MIEGLITRVSQYDRRVTEASAAAPRSRAARAPRPMPAELMQTTKLATFEAEKTQSSSQRRGPGRQPLMDDSTRSPRS